MILSIFTIKVNSESSFKVPILAKLFPVGYLLQTFSENVFFDESSLGPKEPQLNL